MAERLPSSFQSSVKMKKNSYESQLNLRRVMMKKT